MMTVQRRIANKLTIEVNLTSCNVVDIRRYHGIWPLPLAYEQTPQNQGVQIVGEAQACKITL